MSEDVARPPTVGRRVALPLLFRPLDDRASGAGIARTFQKGLALLFALAWLSLTSQVVGLIGAKGLLPLAEVLASAPSDQPLRFAEFPSVLLWLSSDGWLRAGPWLGVVLALAAWLGVWPRFFLGASTLLYLSYAVACRAFLAFQWDNLILEAGFLAVLLPTHEARRAPHLLFRLLVFKLYFESGLAKWQSPAGDWRDGSAMTFYYETAPLPTALALYAHRLPIWWHHLESWATLALELILPFFVFGPRRARLFAFAFFTLFQSGDFATANYGFFCPLAAWLGLFLLGERDLAALRDARKRSFARMRTLSARLCHARVADALRRRSAALQALATRVLQRRPRGLALPPRLASAIVLVAGASWCALSVGQAYAFFGTPGPRFEKLVPLLEPAMPFLLVNTYHLFASVTRERIEPTFEVEVAGAYRELVLRYKPGPLNRPPPFVAPHQPRLDFQLWFHGLAPRRQPSWLARLLGALCEDPAAVRWLFDAPPPEGATAVRVSYFTTHFAEPAGTPGKDRDPTRASGEREERGSWWRRTLAFRTAPMACAGASDEPAAR